MAASFPDDLELDLETLLVRGGLERTPYGETAEALFLTSAFSYPSAEAAEARFDGSDPRPVYSRYNNPTLSQFEQRLRLIEGAEFCLATASGMAAIHAALMAGTRTGDKIVASRALFGSCWWILSELMPRLGVEVTFVDGPDLDQWEQALGRGAALAFLESPANPTLELIDIDAVAARAHAVGAKLIVDNVFATPLLQKPLDLGADIVAYSGTKHIDGQGRCLGGAVLTNDLAWGKERLQPYLRHTGPALSPFNAWVMVKGLETMGVRVEREVASALIVAAALSDFPAMERVLYPFLPDFPQHDLAVRQMRGGGTVVSFVVPKGLAGAVAFQNALRVIDISNNLGDVKSLITHPWTTTHRAMAEEGRRAMGIVPGLLRLSVGLESPGDLIADLERGMAAALRA